MSNNSSTEDGAAILVANLTQENNEMQQQFQQLQDQFNQFVQLSTKNSQDLR